MLPLTIATYALLGTGLLFAVIELGLSAYIVSLFTNAKNACESYYNGYTGVDYSAYCDVPVPGIVSFTIFTAIWTMIVTPFALVYPWLQSRKAGVSHEGVNRWLAPVFIVLFFLTFVFWLAGFADIATLLSNWGVINAGGVIDSIVAFGALSWLIYMTLFILAILTTVDVLPHDLPGWQPMTTRGGNTGAPTTYSSGAPTYNSAAGHDHIINEEPKNNGHPEMVA